ncbi:MAG: hypothetical protein IJ268_14635 [Proteobacteria bacterium]|nr:hypothetical protein [Pseudomonadota bacterium]
MNPSLLRLIKTLAILLTALPMASLNSKEAQALESDWELGALPAAFMMPSFDIYGAGTELFARYDVIDGLSLNAGAGFYGAQQTTLQKPLGLYTLRAGAFYALDVLQWVPGIGINLSALFSESRLHNFHRDGHGMGIDFDLYVQYRGIRHLGIGIFASYHLVFVDADYITAGLSISWYSGMF